jgi:acetylornithine deacetylase/succinyl-diaminopimelate desuccinylase-like protein
VNTDKARKFINDTWNDSIIPQLEEYIRIPNQSPDYDGDWKANGHMDRAADLLEKWILAQEIPGLTLERVETEGRTPLLFMEIPGESDDTILLYGHFDKQPPMVGWEEELGPWKPVIRDGKLYGRGGADDGYSTFASLTALKALKREGTPHARCVVIIEGCEESGSPDLPFYIDQLRERIGEPSLVVCLDSGCANYDQMWTTTSLRGMAAGSLSVSIVHEGLHSGEATGAVPSTFRILRLLLSRIEDPETGEILIPSLNVPIPEQRIQQVKAMAEALGDSVWNHYPFVDGAEPVTKDAAEVILNRTWRPTLAVTGIAGLPDLAHAGNVLRPNTTVKLSVRIPPTADPQVALEDIKEVLEKDPPYGAKVEFDFDLPCGGWNAPALVPWLEEAASKASMEFFGKDACYMGEGGSIPFMGMLGEKFPEAQFLITGVLGPKSNAHGPNEFLHLETGRRLTGCVARVIAEHFHRPKDDQ